ncbi:uncharacterized protein QC761_0029100 [Podospora bellae-mahoneyi]|uniref:Rhamnogalacturonase A/B/Epimerase-like pectate lyase domain-containing protein n=1 Tax=Podospora bellae-mahoneyi TaxID=2093777 RepID=A0ABR0FSI7_9PEZI|nr:hypothetical protein QC761_0029100 [Podospora bellae-mahoneyi]
MKKLAEKKAATGNTFEASWTTWPTTPEPITPRKQSMLPSWMVTDVARDCGSTTVRPALIYFPLGTYKICTPIIQYYFTQFVGDPNNRPIIKGCETFTGMVLMDVNPYIPGSGINWYISQNQFFRQIRNFVFDL